MSGDDSGTPPGGTPPRPPGSAGEVERETVAATELRRESEARADATQQTAKTLRSTAQDLGIAVEKTIELNELERKKLNLLQQSLAAGKNALSTQAEYLMKTRELVAAMQDPKLSVEEKEKLADALKKVEKAMGDLVETTGLGSQAMEQYTRIMAEHSDDPKKLAEELEKLRAKVNDVEKTSDKAQGAMNKFAGALGITAKMADTAGGKIWGIAADLATGFSKDKLALYGKALADMFNPLNIGLMLVDKVFKMAVALDEAAVSFGKATGFGGNFNKQLMNIHESTVRAGMSLKDAQEGLKAVADGFSSFGSISKSAQDSLAVTAMRLKHLGVSTDSSMKIMDNFSRSLRMGAAQSEALTKSIILAGTSIGITATKMASDFQKSFETLAQYGKQAAGVFVGMQAQARAAGVEISTLIGLADKFDTFESAAKSAAGLNAVLGTQISSIELLNADHEQRINIIRSQIQATVGSFDALNKFEQLHVKTALGLSSVAQAQKLMNMSQGEYLRNKSKMASAAKTQQDLKEATEKLVPFMQELKLAGAEFITAFGPYIIKIADAMKWLGKHAKGVIVAMGMMTVLVGAFKTAQFLIWIQGAIASLATLTQGTWAYNAAAWLSTRRVVLIATAFAGLAAILAIVINPPLVAAFAFMAVGMLAFGVASRFAGTKAVIVSLALALMAASIALVFYGISAVIDSFGEFFIILSGSVELLPLIASGIMEISGSLYALAAASLTAFAASVILLAGLAGVGAVLLATGNMKSMEDLAVAGNSIEKIANGLERFSASLKSIKSITAELHAMGSQGFMAVTVGGGQTSMIVANESTIKSVDTKNINVKVDIPEIKVPQPIVHVYLDSKEIAAKVSTEIAGLART